MVTDPDDGDEDEWRFSLEDLEDREDGEDGEDAGSRATESSEMASGGTASSAAAESLGWSTDDASESPERAGDASSDEEADEEEDGGLSAGVAGRMEFDEELEAQEIDVENALFVVFGVLLAIAFFVGFLNLL